MPPYENLSLKFWRWPTHTSAVIYLNYTSFTLWTSLYFHTTWAINSNISNWLTESKTQTEFLAVATEHQTARACNWNVTLDLLSYFDVSCWKVWQKLLTNTRFVSVDVDQNSSHEIKQQQDSEEQNCQHVLDLHFLCAKLTRRAIRLD